MGSFNFKMKQYRLKVSDKKFNHKWTEWRNVDIPFGDADILTIQFNEPLTVEEAKDFFKHYEVR